MESNILKIKQSVFRITISSIFLFIFFLILSIIVGFWLTFDSSWYVIGLLLVFGLISLFCFLALIGGLLFLKVNKNLTDINRIKRKAILDWGLFYFSVSNKIERLLEKSAKKEIIDNSIETL